MMTDSGSGAEGVCVQWVLAFLGLCQAARLPACSVCPIPSPTHPSLHTEFGLLYCISLATMIGPEMSM